MKAFFQDYKMRQKTKREIKEIAAIIQKGACNEVNGYDYLLLDSNSYSCGMNVVLEERHASVSIIHSFKTIFHIHMLYQNEYLQLASFNSSQDSVIQWNNHYPTLVEEMKELLLYLRNITEKKIQQSETKRASTAL